MNSENEGSPEEYEDVVVGLVEIVCVAVEMSTDDVFVVVVDVVVVVIVETD